MRRIWFNFSSPVLSTESEAKFESLRSEFRKGIKPRDEIERMYCDEVACLVWETLRWRRARDATMSTAMRDALYEILVVRLSELEEGQDTVKYLDRWFTSRKIREEVSDKLEKYRLDVSALEAEAFRQCSSDIMLLEQLLSACEARRDRTLRNIAAYRQSLAAQLKDRSIDLLEGGNVLRLEHKNQPRASDGE